MSTRDERVSVADASAELVAEVSAPDDESDAGEFDPFGDANRTVRDARPPPRPRDVGVVPSNDDDAADGESVDGGNTEQDAAPPCATTDCILAAQSLDCLQCTRENGCFDPEQQGGLCEDVTDVGVSADAADAFKTEAPRCRKVLSRIFSTGCAATPAAPLQLTPCLCGSTDTAACIAGTAPPTGPLYQDYADDFCTGVTCSTATIQIKFTVPSTGAGRANWLVQCAAAYDCKSCFGLAPPSTEGGADQ